MDSDLAEAISALREVFQARGLPVEFGSAPPALVESLRAALPLPRRFRAFLSEANPVEFESQTPVERIRLFPAESLFAEQSAFTSQVGWKRAWVVIGRSELLGDPYFLDTALPDAEGDCPVMTSMMGTGAIKSVLAASSFGQFLRIVAASMEVSRGFGTGSANDFDDEDDATFRQALSPRVRVIDQAAHRARHWT